jgi:uncharacterized membrane protein
MFCKTGDAVDSLDCAVGTRYLEAVSVQDPADPVYQIHADLGNLQLLIDEDENVLHP